MSECFYLKSRDDLQKPFRMTLTSHSKQEISLSFFIVWPALVMDKSIRYKFYVGQLTDLVSSRVVVIETTDIRKMHIA